MSRTDSFEYLKFGLVIAAIFLASYLLYGQSGISGATEYMRWFMGVFMATFAAFKLTGYRTFATAFAGYDIIARRFSAYARLFPFIELSLALLYLLDWLPAGRDILVVLISGTAAIGVFKEIYRGKSGLGCACLGNVIKLPLSSISLIENLGMLVMASMMLIL